MRTIFGNIACDHCGATKVVDYTFYWDAATQKTVFALTEETNKELHRTGWKIYVETQYCSDACRYDADTTCIAHQG